MEHVAGGDSPGRWEGECRPNHEVKACSEVQGEEGNFVLRGASSCVSADGLRLPHCDVFHTKSFCRCSVVLLPASAGGRSSVDTSTHRGRDKGRGSCPLHATTLHDGEVRLEAPEEKTAAEGVCSCGGDYAETSMFREIEEGDHIGVRIGGSVAHAADAHAGERCAKRIRTSPPDSTPARQRGESCIYLHYTIYLLGIHWVCLNRFLIELFDT